MSDDEQQQQPHDPQPGDRDVRGRFAHGNRLGRGNPHVAHLSACQRAIRMAVRPEDIVEVLDAVRKQALAGDSAAAAVWLARVMGTPRAEEARVRIDLPSLTTAANCALAAAEIVAALAEGRIDRSGAKLLGELVEDARRSIELRDVVARVEELEQQERLSP